MSTHNISFYGPIRYVLTPAVYLNFLLKFFVTKLNITKTCLYNFDPLKPHFYIEKLGFTGVYIIFLISAQNIDCGYSLEPPRRGSSFLHLFCIRGPGAIGSL